MDKKTALYTITDYNEWITESKLESIFESKYNQQAIDFLLETGTQCIIEKIGQSAPKWGKEPVNTYKVTLENKKHKYSFIFYDSINNTKTNKSLKYDFYSVLASLGHYVPESFDDFCSDFGYEFKNESDYINAKQTHLDCLDQDKNLKKLFTENQLEKLREIN